MDVTAGSGVSLGAGGGAAWFSDGNVRTSGVLAGTRQLPHHLFVGGMVRMVWFRETVPQYFSPDRFTVVEARGGYVRTGTDWETRLKNTVEQRLARGEDEIFKDIRFNIRS